MANLRRRNKGKIGGKFLKSALGDRPKIHTRTDAKPNTPCFHMVAGAGLARGAALFTIITTIVATCLGLYFYKEPVTRIQLAGIFLGFFSLILIFWE